MDKAARNLEQVLASRKEGRHEWRDDWGVGNDLDLKVVLQQSQSPFGRRSVPMETRMLPVPVDMLVYTRREFEEMMQRGGSFPAMLRAEAPWVWRRSDFHGLPS